MKFFVSKSFAEVKLLSPAEILNTFFSYVKRNDVPVGWLARAKVELSKLSKEEPQLKTEILQLYARLDQTFQQRVKVLKIPIKISVQLTKKNRVSVIYNSLAGVIGGFDAIKRVGFIEIEDASFYDVVNFLDRIPVSETRREKKLNSDYAQIVFKNVTEPFVINVQRTGENKTRLVFDEIVDPYSI